MSFTTQVKEDLTRISSSRTCCRRAEFVAFFLINGMIRISGGVSLVMQTENSGVARRMFTLAKDFSFDREVSVYRRSRLKKNQVYRLVIPPQAGISRFLEELGMLDAGDRWRFGFTDQIRGHFLQEPCCCRAFLRGAFLAAGSVAAPDAGSYHLEFNGIDREQADLLLSLLAEQGIPGKMLQRRDNATVYLKGAEHISDFLNIIGSHRSLLEFESVRVFKEVRNQANRLRNCDNANVNKTVAAAARQVEEISYIQRELGMKYLPAKLRAVAELRLEYPDASLTELAELSCLGRSALNHRLRRLEQIADNIRSYGVSEWNRSEARGK